MDGWCTWLKAMEFIVKAAKLHSEKQDTWKVSVKDLEMLLYALKLITIPYFTPRNETS